ncbi:MAG: hypothetical protein V3W41_08340 [Planctomycetota bacterium]
MSRSDTGMGLLEAVIAVGLCTLVLIGVGQFFKSSSDFQESSYRMGGIQGDARLALEALVGELRMADATTVAISNEGDSQSLDFRVPLGYENEKVILSPIISYRYATSGVDSNANNIADDGSLVRSQGGVVRVLCHRLKRINFSRVSSIVTVRLELSEVDKNGRTLTTAVESTTGLRN